MRATIAIVHARRTAATLLAAAAVIGPGGNASAGGPDAPAVRCTVVREAGQWIARVKLWNPDATGKRYRLRVEAQTARGPWRSPALTGVVGPGDVVERWLRPFGGDVPVRSCAVARGPGEPAADNRLNLTPRRRVDHDAEAQSGLLLGTVSAVVLAAAGAVVGSWIDCRDSCSADGVPPLGTILGGLAGYTLGFPAGYAWAADHPGSNSAMGASILGSSLGAGAGIAVARVTGDLTVGGAAILVLPPVGAIVGYYLFHDHVDDVDPLAGALLRFDAGSVSIGVPAVTVQRTLAGGSAAVIPLASGRM